MKTLKINLLVLISFIAISFSVNAQKFEGKITYEINYTSLPEGMEQYASMLPSEQIIYIKNTLSRIESSMGMGGTQAVVNDSKKKTAFILMDMMGQKMVMKLSKEDLEGDKDKQPTIKYVDGTKEIAGYKCKKAEITVPGSEDVVTVYYTEDLPSGTNSQYKELKGFPLEYEVSQQGMIMQFTAKEVSKDKVSDELFEIPEGYTETTKDDLGKMMGGGH
jgi:GLPGLI family protein